MRSCSFSNASLEKMKMSCNVQVITKKVKKHVQLDKKKSVTTGSIRYNTEASTENVKNDDIENVIETKDDTRRKSCSMW